MATEIATTVPETLPITIDQYRVLVEQGTFVDQPGQILDCRRGGAND